VWALLLLLIVLLPWSLLLLLLLPGFALSWGGLLGCGWVMLDPWVVMTVWLGDAARETCGHK
jgi:hypothetical protein